MEIEKEKDSEIEQWYKDVTEDIKDSSRDVYKSSLYFIKHQTGAKNLSEFSEENPRHAKDLWNDFVDYLKKSTTSSTSNLYYFALKNYFRSKSELEEELSDNSIASKSSQLCKAIHKPKEELFNNANTKTSESRKKTRSRVVNKVIKYLNENKNFDELDLNDQFLLSHTYYGAFRISEVAQGRTIDVDVVEYKGESYKVIQGFAVKTNEPIWRPVWEENYWDTRNEYVKDLGYNKKHIDDKIDYLFPSNKLDPTTKKVAVIETRKLRDRLKKSMTIVFGEDEVWPHQLRHARTSALHEMGFSLDSLNKLRGDASMATTQRYVDDKIRQDQLLEAVSNIN